MTRRAGETEMQYKARLDRERRDREATARNAQIQHGSGLLDPGNLGSPLNPIHHSNYSSPPAETPRSEPSSPSSSDTSSSSSFSSTDSSGASSFG
jgi:hypothetical protein